VENLNGNIHKRLENLVDFYVPEQFLIGTVQGIKLLSSLFDLSRPFLDNAFKFSAAGFACANPQSENAEAQPEYTD
jgi:hypothetical protein